MKTKTLRFTSHNLLLDKINSDMERKKKHAKMISDIYKKGSLELWIMNNMEKASQLHLSA